MAAVLLADLQVSVEGDFVGAAATLARVIPCLRGAALLESLASQSVYSAVAAAQAGEGEGGADWRLAKSATGELLKLHSQVFGKVPKETVFFQTGLPEGALTVTDKECFRISLKFRLR